MQFYMLDFFGGIFDTAGFPARWQCGLWTPEHGWLHIASDLFIWGAYFTIPAVLVYFIRKQPDLPLPRVVWLFAIFIFACGTGHLLEAMIFWWPAYRLAAIVKTVTAIASWATVFALVRLAPPALELPGAAARTDQLEKQHAQAVGRADRAEYALQETTAKLELPIKAGKIGTLVMSGPGRRMVVNDRLREMFGFSDEFEPMPEDMLSLVHADDRERLRAALAHTRKTGEPYAEEFQIVSLAGEVNRVSVQGGGWKEASDSDFLVTGVCTIVQEAELALRESQRRLHMAVDAAQAGFWSWNVTTNEAEWDERMERIFGVAPGRFNCKYEGFAECVHPDDLPKVEQALQAALDGGPQFRIIHRIRSGGSWRHVEEHGMIDWSSDGKPLRMTGLCLDITERISAQQGLHHATKELDEFAYVASHDLRAPMRAIDNLAQWIVEDAAEFLPEASRGHLEKLQQRVKRMERLLDDIQKFSRAGRLSFESEELDLHALVVDTIQTLSPPAGFEVRVEGVLPTIVSGRSPLEQIFLNLIGNAIKHHDRDSGTVVVSATESTMFVEITVEDDGPGIPEELRGRAFQMFETLKPRDHVEGSGIGLAVVNKLIQSVGGRIWITSGAVRGTAFHFTWPKTLEGAG